SAITALAKFRDKLEAWGMPGSLRDLGVKDDDLPKLVEIILSASPTGVGGVFKLDQKDLQALLVLAF
ncbi:MAG: NADH-dependent alcohol dehydrogenase, partial [Candidatus Cloacimonetes bacterium]|nr:NADH-dependent alcohol dehydrogenase [Candidatus Cloacimonadota bacterium]